MFHDLDRALAGLIAREVDLPGLVTRFSTVPGQLADAGGAPTVHFLLYNVSENKALRRGDWDLERDDAGRAHRSRPAVRLDCHYMVSVWVGDDHDAVDEHRIAGAVVRALFRHKRLPADLLEGELAGQEPPVRVRVARKEFLDTLYWLWSTIGAGPKLAFDYSVTISLDTAEAEDLGPVVTGHVLAVRPTPL